MAEPIASRRIRGRTSGQAVRLVPVHPRTEGLGPEWPHKWDHEPAADLVQPCAGKLCHLCWGQAARPSLQRSVILKTPDLVQHLFAGANSACWTVAQTSSRAFHPLGWFVLNGQSPKVEVLEFGLDKCYCKTNEVAVPERCLTHIVAPAARPCRTRAP